MPLQIIRNDITKVQADAIVNATNELLIPGGTGVDASIHAAAGPELAEALKKVGTCPEGEAVVTNSFNISGCKHIIHTATPAYVDGHTEREALGRCYRSVLKAAADLCCESIAIPILSAGSMGVPASEAYSIATGVIREYLTSYDLELMVYLVVFSSDVVRITGKLHDAVEHYIDDIYVDEKKNILRQAPYEYSARPHRTASAPGRPACRPQRRNAIPRFPEKQEDYEADYMPLHYGQPNIGGGKAYRYEICSAPGVAVPEAAVEALPENYRDMDLSFGDMCDWWMKKKQISVGTFYNDANISRAAFHNIRKHSGSVPRKTTALACAIGLKLRIDEAVDLLNRAGYTLSPYYKTDVVVRYYIENGNYDIDDINAELFEYDLALLGSSAS